MVSHFQERTHVRTGTTARGARRGNQVFSGKTADGLGFAFRCGRSFGGLRLGCGGRCGLGFFSFGGFGFSCFSFSGFGFSCFSFSGFGFSCFSFSRFGFGGGRAAAVGLP
ncbi:MAG: hypothetical protein D6680_21815 [Cyanobacteria bacterium J007]|nr:MAG: hypothetical protein D6680_21815 [Cyanobacteria bacterium J007]